MADREYARSASTTAKYISMAVFLLGTVASEVLGKRVAIAAPQFPGALTILTGLLGAIVYSVVVAVALRCGLVTRHQVQTGWRIPLVISTLFALHNTLFNAGNMGTAVPGTLTLLLTKLKIPLTMFMSMPKFAMGNIYGWSHWTGLMMMMLGIFLTISSLLHDLHLHMARDTAAKIFLIASSDIPLAGAFVFIEKHLKHVHPTMFTTALWMWVCIAQVPISFMTVWIFGLLYGLDSHAVVVNLSEGISCYVLGMMPTSEPGAKCSEAQIYYLWSLPAGFAVNFAMPLVTRYGSAGIMWFVRAVALPATVIAFAMPWAMGSHATAMAPLQVLGLVVVGSGVTLFNWRDPLTRSASPASVSLEQIHPLRELQTELATSQN